MTDDTESTPAQAPARGHPHGRGSRLTAIAAIGAAIALVLAAWSLWQLHRTQRTAVAARGQFTAELADLQTRLAAAGKQGDAGAQRTAALESELDDLRSDVKGLSLRTTNVETALTSLSGQQQSAHDTVLLDDVEMLLRTGQQRFTLFHDSVGAEKAYAQAIDVLAQVQNPVYAPVRVSAITERDALTAAAPQTRQTTLDTLSALRGEVATLKLVPADAPVASASAKPGFWGRMAQSFSGVVRVSRDDGSAATATDAGFARQALALDLAQAQEAILAFDAGTGRSALARAAKLLASQFDGQDPAVAAARAKVDGLLAQRPPAAAPQLGGALAQLRSLRASQPPPPPPPPAAAPATHHGGKSR